MKTTETLKLSDRGTSGLLQWIAAGEARLPMAKLPGIRAAKTARAAAIIRQRHGKASESVFRMVARREATARDAVRYIATGTSPESMLIQDMASICRVPVRILADRAIDYALEHGLAGTVTVTACSLPDGWVDPS